MEKLGFIFIIYSLDLQTFQPAVSLCKLARLTLENSCEAASHFHFPPCYDSDWKTKFRRLQRHQRRWWVFFHSTWQKSQHLGTFSVFYFFPFFPQSQWDLKMFLEALRGSPAVLVHSAAPCLLQLGLSCTLRHSEAHEPQWLHWPFLTWPLRDFSSSHREAEPGSLIRDVTVQLVRTNDSWNADWLTASTAFTMLKCSS